MKKLNNVFMLFLILTVVIKVIDLSSPSIIDIALILLFIINAVLSIISIKSRLNLYYTTYNKPRPIILVGRGLIFQDKTDVRCINMRKSTFCLYCF